MSSNKFEISLKTLHQYVEKRHIPLSKEYALPEPQDTLATLKDTKMWFQEIESGQKGNLYVSNLRKLARVIIILDNILYYFSESNPVNPFANFPTNISAFKYVFNHCDFSTKKNLLQKGFIVIDYKTIEPDPIWTVLPKYNAIFAIASNHYRNGNVTSSTLLHPEEITAIIDLDHFDLNLLNPHHKELLFGKEVEKNDKEEKLTCKQTDIDHAEILEE